MDDERSLDETFAKLMASEEAEAGDPSPLMRRGHRCAACGLYLHRSLFDDMTVRICTACAQVVQRKAG